MGARASLWSLVAVGVALTLSACDGAGDSLQKSPSRGSDFPRAIELDGRTVTIPERPNRVAILSPSIGEAAYKLIDHSRIAAVSSTLHNDLLSNVAALARRTPIALPGGFQMDPEQVLALNPDLVLVERAHDAERDAEGILARAGIPVVELTRWDTIARIRTNFFLLGRALAAESNAAHIVARMDARVAEVRKAVGGVDDKPVVLALSGFAAPLVNGRGTITDDVIAAAGGINASELMHTGPWDQADVEKIIAADPDFIALIDLHGTGIAGFSAILDHPGMQAVTAVRHRRIKVFLPRVMMSVGADQVVDGLVDLARWIHPQQFTDSE
jgi:iron complex transport system substrate-binding protein